MKTTFIRLGLMALMFSLLAGCSGSGKDGAAGVNGTSYLVKVGDNSVSPTADSIAAWKALAPQVTITSVTVAGQPVVNFTVKDAAGNSVVGLGNKSKGTSSTSSTVAGLTNIDFALAKLVPVTGGPSKWVSYNIVRPPTNAEATGTMPVNSSCNAAKTWCGTYPATDTQGTLVDNGDGTYQYTFLRDPTQAATIVAGLTDSVDTFAKKADLGDVSFDATLTHRLGIQIGGAAPGTGSNTPTATTVTTGVNMVNTANVVYDFRPDGGTISNTRDIVKIDSCADCHRSKVLAHGSRKDPKYCVTCHTDQIKYSFDSGDAVFNADGVTFAVQDCTPGTSSSACNAIVRPAQAILYGRAVGNYPNLIHHVHMGEDLVKQGYHFNNADGGLFNDVRFPQDQRNCTKCHDGASTDAKKITANGDNWKNIPSRLACGGCHDGINFADGTGVTFADRDHDLAVGNPAGTTKSGHGAGGVSGGVPGAQSDDSSCSSCHTPSTIMVTHIPVTLPDSNNQLIGGTNANTNAASIASNTNNLPAGAIKVTYDIKSVTRNASRQPVMVFRLLQDGNRADFNTYNSGVAKTDQEIWTNFVGAPSVYFVFAVPQDGITTPADFNASASAYLRDLWNATGSKGTLTLDTATGYYTATLTTVTIPDNAVMLTGGLGYTYSVKSTLPLTQTNIAGYTATKVTPTNVTAYGLDANMPNWTGGLIVVAPDAQTVASKGAGTPGTGGTYSGRRPIVEDARCNKCHQELGVFAKSSFHAAQRNDGTTCSWCHNPNRTSSGWSADSTNHVHAIHAGLDSTGTGTTVNGIDKRVNQFTWHAGSTTDGFWAIGFPGVLKQCETCHLPGTYDFSAAASASALPNRLYRTVATGIFPASGVSVTTTFKVNSPTNTACVAGSASTGTELTAFSLSPYVTQSTNPVVPDTYGAGFGVNLGATPTYGCTPDGTFYTIPAATASAAGTVEAEAKTLVSSPIATACFACHDTSLARLHMESNGGSMYRTRGAPDNALAKPEQCMICHGTGRVADIKAMHDK